MVQDIEGSAVKIDFQLDVDLAVVVELLVLVLKELDCPEAELQVLVHDYQRNRER